MAKEGRQFKKLRKIEREKTYCHISRVKYIPFFQNTTHHRFYFLSFSLQKTIITVVSLVWSIGTSSPPTIFVLLAIFSSPNEYSFVSLYFILIPRLID